MRLMGDNILVKKLDIKKQTTIILTGATTEKIFIGEIVSKGIGFTTNTGVIVPIKVEVGEKIMFSSTTGWHVKTKVGEFIVMPVSSIICILDSDDIEGV